MLEEYRTQLDEIDQELCKLFEKRMHIVKSIAQYKQEHSLPIEDLSREQAMLEKNTTYLNDVSLKKYYEDWLTQTIRISKQYQKEEEPNG